MFELMQHMKGRTSTKLMEGVKNNIREMIEEQEVVRGRLFTIQDGIQNTLRASLQAYASVLSRGLSLVTRMDKSMRMTHYIAVIGGCGMVLLIITGLFGININGIPGSKNAPYGFAIFSTIFVILVATLIYFGFYYLGIKTPIKEMENRKIELNELVELFQQEAESHSSWSRP